MPTDHTLRDWVNYYLWRWRMKRWYGRHSTWTSGIDGYKKLLRADDRDNLGGS